MVAPSHAPDVAPPSPLFPLAMVMSYGGDTTGLVGAFLPLLDL